MIVSFFIHLKNRRILSFSFCLRPVEFTQVCKTYVAGESPLQQETEQGFFRLLRIALCLTPLTTFQRERKKKSPQRARYQTGTAKESCTQRKMSSKSFQHSFSSGERVQDQRKPEHLFLFALPRGLTGPWAQWNKVRIQILHLKKRLKKAIP